MPASRLTITRFSATFDHLGLVALVPPRLIKPMALPLAKVQFVRRPSVCQEFLEDGCENAPRSLSFPLVHEQHFAGWWIFASYTSSRAQISAGKS